MNIVIFFSVASKLNSDQPQKFSSVILRKLILNPVHIVVTLMLQGFNLAITVWDYDADNTFVPYDLVDEFVYSYTDFPGKPSKYIDIFGKRLLSPTE